jgi:hypothetical protein
MKLPGKWGIYEVSLYYLKPSLKKLDKGAGKNIGIREFQ